MRDFSDRDRAIRVFECPECGHRMRLTGTRCGYCHHPKALYQQAFLLIPLGLFLVVATVLVAVVLPTA